jgi:hypothetical protein
MAPESIAIVPSQVIFAVSLSLDTVYFSLSGEGEAYGGKYHLWPAGVDVTYFHRY